MRRRQLEAHNRDPNVIAKHMQTVYQELQEVLGENQRLREQSKRDKLVRMLHSTDVISMSL